MTNIVNKLSRPGISCTHADAGTYVCKCSVVAHNYMHVCVVVHVHVDYVDVGTRMQLNAC